IVGVNSRFIGHTQSSLGLSASFRLNAGFSGDNPTIQIDESVGNVKANTKELRISAVQNLVSGYIDASADSANDSFWGLNSVYSQPSLEAIRYPIQGVVDNDAYIFSGSLFGLDQSDGRVIPMPGARRNQDMLFGLITTKLHGD